MWEEGSKFTQGEGKTLLFECDLKVQTVSKYLKKLVREEKSMK